MTDTYMVYADDLKDALLSDEITRLIVYGSDGEKVEYYRADSIQTMTREEHEALHKHTDSIQPDECTCCEYRVGSECCYSDVRDDGLLEQPVSKREWYQKGYKAGYKDGEKRRKAVVSNVDLLSAQPEIIRCKDCKHMVREDYEEYTPYGFYNTIWSAFCDKLWDEEQGEYISVKIDDYCSFAERRTDEQTD